MSDAIDRAAYARLHAAPHDDAAEACLEHAGDEIRRRGPCQCGREPRALPFEGSYDTLRSALEVVYGLQRTLRTRPELRPTLRPTAREALNALESSYSNFMDLTRAEYSA